MTLGQIIKNFRINNGLSQDAFAEKAGFSKAYVSILERNYNPSSGEPPIPSLKTINSVAKVVGEDFDSLFRSLDGDITVSLGDSIPSSRFTPVRPLPSSLEPIGKGSYVPLIGNIACGVPILAVEDATEEIWMPSGVNADYALTCQGDSMVNARIFDGDYVYIRTQEQVENGEIAAVVVNDEEVTLKRVYYYPEDDKVILQAENPSFRDQVYRGEEINHFRVLGKVEASLTKIN